MYSQSVQQVDRMRSFHESPIIDFARSLNVHSALPNWRYWYIVTTNQQSSFSSNSNSNSGLRMFKNYYSIFYNYKLFEVDIK